MVVGVWIQRMGLAAGVLLLFSGMGEAIDVNLDPATVKKAVEDGKQMKDVKTIPTRFGADLSKDLCGGGGEIQTKTVGLNRLGAVIAANPEKAEQDKDKVEEAIQKTAESKRLKIVFDYCGDTADFAKMPKPPWSKMAGRLKARWPNPIRRRRMPRGRPTAARSPRHSRTAASIRTR